MSFAEKIDWPSIMESVARHLLGEPNPRLSNSRQMRWGRNGSMSVDLDKGTFYDHEAKIGGGVTDLIKYKTGCDHAAAVRWLQAEGYADRPTLIYSPAERPQIQVPSSASAAGIEARTDPILKDHCGDLRLP